MSAARVPRRLSVREYLLVENGSPYRSEFYEGRMYAMAGASRPHNAIKENLIGELFTRLRGGPCRTYSSDQRVRVPSGLYTYPDVVVVCGPAEADPLDDKTLVNPRVLVEVLSPATAEYDRGDKFEQYQMINGLAQVLFVSQEIVWAEVHTRRPDGRWVEEFFTDMAGELELSSLGVRIPLADLYRDAVPPSRPLRDPNPA